MRVPAAAVLFCVAAGVSAGAAAEPAQAPAPPAAAPAAPTAVTPANGNGASAHHRRGAEHFARGEYDAAVSEFRKAYELEADPAVLYDIALAYQELGAPERARFFYRRYLSAAPTAANRQEVEARLEALDRVLPAAPLAPAAGASPDLSVDLAEPPPPPQEPAARPLVRRWWFWAAVGAVATGATISLVAWRRSRGDDVPPSELGNAKLF
jgi:tetratricopeptide (TPR) repeat protein